MSDRSKTIWVEDCKMYKIRSGYGMNFVCCDCGLVHRMFFKPAGRGWLNFMCKRDNRATAPRRRSKKLARVAAAIRTVAKKQAKDASTQTANE